MILALLGLAAADPGCAPVPQREWIVEVVSREANPPPDREEPEPVRHRLATVHGLDLDGDGRPDSAVPTVEPFQCPHEAKWTLYATRGDCPASTGEVVGFPQAREAGEPLREVLTERRWAALTDTERPPGPHNVATLHEVRSIWTWTDGAWVERVEEHRAGICHHCGMSRCRVLEGPEPR